MQRTTANAVQVVLTTGPKDPTRARLGLDAALAAAASGLDVAVFLTLEATAWACEPRRFVCGEAVYDLIDQVRGLGAAVSCCGACASERCGAGGEPAAVADAAATTPGIELVGLLTLMERVARGVPTVTF